MKTETTNPQHKPAQCDWCSRADRPLCKYSAEPHIAPRRFFCSLECHNSYYHQH